MISGVNNRRAGRWLDNSNVDGGPLQLYNVIAGGFASVGWMGTSDSAPKAGAISRHVERRANDCGRFSGDRGMNDSSDHGMNDS